MKKTTKRRTKRADLVDRPQTRRSKAGRKVSRSSVAIWRPIRRFLSFRVNTPAPKGKFGKILGKRIRGPRYFRESWVELKKVEWPDRRESWRLTGAVFVFAVVLATFTALADFGFSKAVQKILIK